MKYLLLFLMISLIGCNKNSKYDSNNNIIIIEQEGVEVFLEDIVDSVKLLKLNTPDSIFFGQIEKIKIFDDLIFLMDSDNTQTITIYDFTGQFITQLNNVGEGPNQYLSLDAFSYRDKCIYIHSRGVGLKGYSFPDFELMFTLKDKQTYSDFEPLGAHYWITISDSPDQEGSYVGYEVKNAQFQREKNLKELGSLPMSIEFASAWAFYKEDENLYVLTHNEENVVYKMNSLNEISEYKRINFGKNTLPKEVWNDFNFMKLSEEMNTKNRSIMPHLLIKDANKISFWFRSGGIYKSQLAISYLETDKVEVFSSLKSNIFNGAIPSPIGYNKSYYISYVQGEDLNYINDFNSDDEDSFLIFYNIK